MAHLGVQSKGPCDTAVTLSTNVALARCFALQDAIAHAHVGCDRRPVWRQLTRTPFREIEPCVSNL